MEWEYSTSREVSTPQPGWSGLSVGLNGGTGPAGWMILNDGGAGRPYAWSNVCRSLWIVGDPYESTITIVSPRPVSPALYRGFMLYACSNWPGP